jgi:putative transposase
LEQKYALKAGGYDFDSAVQRVAQVMCMSTEEVTAYDKSPQTVKARALLCFWAHRKLGMTTVGISAKLGICQSAVSRLSKRGEAVARELGVELLEKKA